jgi:hypothetical protein
MVKLCGNIITNDIISESNALWLHFHTDEKNQDKGFNLSFSSESDGKLCNYMHSVIY